MINHESFTLEWINALKKEHPQTNIDPQLMEKMIYALALAEELGKNGLSFIFKGGTSLVLLLDAPQRFSIDIDIVTQASRAELETVLDKVCKNGRFKEYQLDTKRSYIEGVPKAHYKFLFEPKFNNPNDNRILLDVIFSENPYPQVKEIIIVNSWLSTSLPATFVTVPSIESIIGDKLTAYAPHTTGIQYGKDKHTEIIKQMFDLGQLFDKIEQFEIVAFSFEQNAYKEISYRAELLGKKPQDVLDDIWNTCIDFVLERQDELKRGMLAFKNWSLYPFRKDEAIEVAGKIAYIVAKLKIGDNAPLLKFDESHMKKSDFLITEQEYNFLNRKVKNANNAIFYWHHAIKCINK